MYGNTKHDSRQTIGTAKHRGTEKYPSESAFEGDYLTGEIIISLKREV